MLEGGAVTAEALRQEVDPAEEIHVGVSLSTTLAGSRVESRDRPPDRGGGVCEAYAPPTTWIPPHQAPVWRRRPPNAATGLLCLPPAIRPGLGHDLALAARYQAAASWLGSGGDWFDAFRIPHGGAALVLGDVAGHDALAAESMTRLRALIREHAMSSDAAPSEVIRRIDRSLCRLRPGLLATVFYGQVRPGRDGGLVLRWCSAGHLPPLLLDGNGDTHVLNCADDVLLGVGTEIPRSDLSIALPADTTLLLFSDGLVETRAADLDTGVNRLRLAARPLASLDVMDLCDTLLPAMVDSRSPDDVALLAVRSSRSASVVGL